MTDIGIIGAMDIEVAGLVAALEGHKCENVSGISFHTGKIYGKSVVVAKCGIGKVFAAVCTEAMILKYSPRIIINTGVGGAVRRGLSVGDIVVADKLVQHDMDTSAIGDPVGLVSGINKIYFEADTAAAELLVSSAERLGLRAVCGTVATGDKFIASEADKSRIADSFSASVCEMEGGAIAHTAFVNGTPFAVVRAVSDSADEESSMSYETFLPMAAENSLSLTCEFIKSFN